MGTLSGEAIMLLFLQFLFLLTKGKFLNEKRATLYRKTQLLLQKNMNAWGIIYLLVFNCTHIGRASDSKMSPNIEA